MSLERHGTRHWPPCGPATSCRPCPIEGPPQSFGATDWRGLAAVSAIGRDRPSQRRPKSIVPRRAWPRHGCVDSHARRPNGDNLPGQYSQVARCGNSAIESVHGSRLLDTTNSSRGPAIRSYHPTPQHWICCVRHATCRVLLRGVVESMRRGDRTVLEHTLVRRLVDSNTDRLGSIWRPKSGLEVLHDPSVLNKRGARVDTTNALARETVAQPPRRPNRCRLYSCGCWERR